MPVGCHSSPNASAAIEARLDPGTVQAIDQTIKEPDGAWGREVSRRCWLRLNPAPVQLASSETQAEQIATAYRPVPSPTPARAAVPAPVSAASGVVQPAAAPAAPAQPVAAQPAPVSNAYPGHIFYASTYHRGFAQANRIYCDTDPGWKRLSPRYLVSFSSLEAAMAALPGYHLHQPC